MYTVIYKFNGRYYVTRYNSKHQLVDCSSLTHTALVACTWGTEIARWGDD